MLSNSISRYLVTLVLIQSAITKMMGSHTYDFIKKGLLQTLKVIDE